MEESLFIVKPYFFEYRDQIIGMASALLGDDTQIRHTVEYNCVSSDFVNELYVDALDEPYFPKILENWVNKSAQIVIFQGGDGLVEKLAKISGETDPLSGKSGTIRRTFAEKIASSDPHYAQNEGLRKSMNVIHRSLIADDALREVAFVKRYFGL